jgi:hypothetical protein
MLAILAFVAFLAAAVIAGIQRGWVEVLLAVGLACWLWQTGAGLIP